MRFLVCVMALGVLGCCFGPSVEAPPSPAAAPAAPSPLSQALEGLVAPTDPATPPPASAPTAPDAAAAGAPPAPPPAAPPSPAAAPGFGASAPAAASTASPACAEATASRDAVRARLADLRLSLGAETSLRLEAAGQAMIACDGDPACVRDGKARLARIEAYDRAKAAHEAERTRLAQAEVGLYDADRAVAAACGTP